jgi:hypothetical protein
LELASDGYSIREAEFILKIPHATIGSDLILLRKQARANIRKYIDERAELLPSTVRNTLNAIKTSRSVGL